MEKITINGKEYTLDSELIAYIKELEYYYQFKIGTRVIDVHYGITGHIVRMFNDYQSIPQKIVHGNHDEFIENLGVPISKELRKTYWFLVKDEDSDSFYILPYVYWKIMPPASEDEAPKANRISDV